MLAEMRSADFIVDICEYWGENVDEAMLESLGFEPMDLPSIDPDCYRIWRKTKHLARPTVREQIGQSDRRERQASR